MSEICITFWRKSEKSARFPPTSKNKKHVLFSIEIWKICEISTYFKNRKKNKFFFQLKSEKTASVVFRIASS